MTSLLDQIRQELGPMSSKAKARKLLKIMLEGVREEEDMASRDHDPVTGSALEWRPMSEAPRIPDEPIIICRPGSTDHYMVAEWSDGFEGDELEGVYAWRDQVYGSIIWTDEEMAQAFSPAMWKPLGAPPPSSLCHDGPKPQWVQDWQDAYRERERVQRKTGPR